VNGQQAILDRPTSAEPGVEPVRAAAASDRGPWLQLGSVQRFAWSRFDLPVTSLPPALAGLRILQLSDLTSRPHGILRSMTSTSASATTRRTWS